MKSKQCSHNLQRNQQRVLPADLCTDHAHYVKNHRSTVLRRNKNMAVQGETVSHQYFMIINCKFSPSIIPQVLVTLTTRSNSNRNVTHFISRKCNTVTFQRSFFNRSTRIWNTLASDLQLSCNLQISLFKSIMYKYYVDALERNYDPENPRSWKTICPSCNISRNVSVHLRCCF